jgi:hypothetical protein
MSTVLRDRPRTTPRRTGDDLLNRYLRALDRYGDPRAEREYLPYNGDIRTCASCGETAVFRLDPAGGWAFCTACGHAA